MTVRNLCIVPFNALSVNSSRAAKNSDAFLGREIIVHQCKTCPEVQAEGSAVRKVLILIFSVSSVPPWWVLVLFPLGQILQRRFHRHRRVSRVLVKEHLRQLAPQFEPLRSHHGTKPEDARSEDLLPAFAAAGPPGCAFFAPRQLSP